MHLLLALLLILPLPAAAWEPDGMEVDVELVLAVDVSRSVSPGEMEIQRRGYAEAITSHEVMTAVRAGLLGRIAVTYLEWSGAHSQRTIVDWTLIESEADARAFAATLTSGLDGAMRRTSISGALMAAAEAFEDNGYSGLRQVIDISGDGPNNQGRPVHLARDSVLSRGIVINGLPLMTREGMGGNWHLDDLDMYYRDCVIGGPGAFVIPVTSWDQFASAVRRKLVLELVGRMPEGPVPVQGRQPYDCLIGEKIWERNRVWGMP